MTRRLPPPLALVLAALAFALTSPISAASKIAALDEKWLWVSNSRFEILTNGSERRAKEVVLQLESFRSTIAQMMGGQITDPPKPVRVLLFDRVWHMAPYQALGADGKPESFAGYYVGRGETNYFALSNEYDDQVPRIVLHEYSHLLVRSLLGRQPTWLNEGLAEYLSAFHYAQRERRAEIGRPIAEHMRYLNSSSHFPLRQLLAMTYDSAEFARDVPRGLFYAKSWLLVHYLQIGSTERAGALARFAQGRAQGMDDIPALEAAAGCSIEQLDEELSTYQRKSLVNYKAIELPDDPRAQSTETRPADTSDAVYRLGEYLLALGPSRKGDAEAHFAASGRSAPAESPTFASAAATAPPAHAVAPSSGAGTPYTPPDPAVIAAKVAEDLAIGEKYAAALDLVNAQKIEAGGDALEKLIREHPETTWAGLARTQLETVDAYLERKRGTRPKRDLPPPSPPPS